MFAVEVRDHFMVAHSLPSEVFGPAQGLAEIDAALSGGALDAYHLAHAARADMLRRLGRSDEARASYARALKLARQAPERRFLEKRLAAL